MVDLDVVLALLPVGVLEIEVANLAGHAVVLNGCGTEVLVALIVVDEPLLLAAFELEAGQNTQPVAISDCYSPNVAE